jgi:imidazoleglycerol-phosphate dehydratase
MRTATITRVTAETNIALSLDLDGTGQADIDTGIGFLDHMLATLARHAQFDLRIKGTGDLHVDLHHMTEDVGIVLGQAIRQALGDKRGISRFGQASVPMDEALVDAALDISGRAWLNFGVQFPRDRVGEMDTELFEEFFRALTGNARITLHLIQRGGSNTHHIAEACFKASARALRQAVEIDPQLQDEIPSTKGTL